MNKFIIAIDNGTKEEQDAITEYIRSKGWQLWHWIEDVWLISGVPDSIGAQSLDMAMREAIPKLSSHIVMKITGNTSYWGRLNKDAWPWMRENWGKVSED